MCLFTMILILILRVFGTLLKHLQCDCWASYCPPILLGLVKHSQFHSERFVVLEVRIQNIFLLKNEFPEGHKILIQKPIGSFRVL